MARSVKKYLKISKGQISKNLVERTDIGILDDSGQEITNFYDTKYGALQTVAGTEFMFNFGKDAKVKLHTIHLSDNKEATLAFDATNQKLYLFDYQGNQLDQISFPYITEENYERSNIAQQEELVLLATGDNPIVRINTTSNKLGAEIFNIKPKNILKVSNLGGTASGQLVYENKKNGDYQYVIQREETIIIRISGAGGGKFYGKPNADNEVFSAVNGEFYEYTYTAKVGDIIHGTIGECGKESAPPNGGTGYNNGFDGSYTADGSRAGGGGGGSSSLFINDALIYEASGGRGANVHTLGLGGFGGGPLGDKDNTGRSNGAKGYLYWKVNDPIKGELVWQERLPENGFITILRKDIPVGEDIIKNTTFINSATAGIINISTPISGGSLFSLVSPEYIDPQEFAKATVIGTNFDSDSAIGVVKITDIDGKTAEDGRTFLVTKISGPTIVGFDKVYTKDDPATGFKITTSLKPAFSSDYPSTQNNPTNDTNYPNLITFYQQRLVIFGTQYNQEQVLFSNIGEYDNFTDDYLSTSAFQLVIGSDQKESIRAFCLNQGIQIFTNVSEWLMDAQTITRTTGFVPNSQMGTNGVKPIISANGTTLFCPKNGKGIIGFIYNERSASYMTPYISMFTDLLDVEIRDLFLKRGRDSQDDTLLYICDADGNLIIGNYIQDHNIQGFCRRSATGVKFLQSVQNEENVLLLSSRAGYTTLERIDQSKKTAHSTRLFQYNQNTGVITLELPQYQNTLLNVYDENGEFVDAYTCENNQITIPSKPQGISEIGYNIHQVFHSNPMNIGGITMSEYKSIARIDIAVTSESKVDALTINKKYGRRKGNLVSYVRPQRPTRDCTFTIENDIYPVEILSMEVEIEY